MVGENNLPLETEKEEVLHLWKNRKMRNADRKYVKWLGVENLSKLGDILPVGFGDAGGGMVDDELAEEGKG